MRRQEDKVHRRLRRGKVDLIYQIIDFRVRILDWRNTVVDVKENFSEVIARISKYAFLIVKRWRGSAPLHFGELSAVPGLPPQGEGEWAGF
jgi:hypothetical protein